MNRRIPKAHLAMRIESSVLVCLFVFSVASDFAQDKSTQKKITNPFAKDKTAIEAGRVQFNSGCADCHGPTGQGGRGPRLAEVYRVQRMPDAKMFEIIQKGLAGTEMPPSALSDEKLWQLVSFIRSLNVSAIDQAVPGDVAAGKSLFFAGGKCSACHMVRGRGGLIGPDLSNIGAQRSQDKLRQAIQDPDARIEHGYSKVTAVTVGGQRISGVAKIHSNYSILIQDAAGSFHSLLRKDLSELIHHKGSLMPRLPLSETEQQNLLAFLSQQSLARSVEQTSRVE